jgi:molybdopterin biosynthesis enzyme
MIWLQSPKGPIAARGADMLLTTGGASVGGA